jgi:hypothetical protein
MACTKCNNTGCGCKDTPAPIPFVAPCPADQIFPDPSPCAESTIDTCVKHRANYTIYGFLNELGFAGLSISPDTTLEQVYQMLSLDLEQYAVTCPPPTDVHLSYLGTTSAIVNWSNTLSLGETYSIKLYTNPDAAPILVVTGLTTTQYTLTGLTAGSTYYVRITTNCVTTDESVSAVIQFTMNS